MTTTHIFRTVFFLVCLTIASLPLTWGQENCPERGISTNPEAPVNNFIGEPWLNNGDFDWTTNLWPVLMTGGQEDGEMIFSPFFEDGSHPNIEAMNLNGDDRDFEPEDGWELVVYQNGYMYEGASPNFDYDFPEDHPIFVLYNRHRSVLRVFILQNEGLLDANHQQAFITVKHVDGTQNAVLSPLGDQSKALDAFDKTVELSGMNRVNASSRNWMYADFMMLYDPCVCHYDSRLEIEVRNIQRLGITANGSISTGNYGLPF